MRKAATGPKARKLKRSVERAISFDHGFKCDDKRIRVPLILLSFANRSFCFEPGRNVPENGKAKEGVSSRPLKADPIPHPRDSPHFALYALKDALICCLAGATNPQDRLSCSAVLERSSMPVPADVTQSSVFSVQKKDLLRSASSRSSVTAETSLKEKLGRERFVASASHPQQRSELTAEAEDWIVAARLQGRNPCAPFRPGVGRYELPS